MMRATRRGFGTVSVMVAIVAALGGFGCICNVGNRARCGGEEDVPWTTVGDAEASDAGDPDSGD